MDGMKPTTMFNIAKRTAFFSFAIGSLIFLLFCLTKSIIVAICGILYGLIAFLINVIVSGYIIFKAEKKPENGVAFIKVSAIMILNISIFLLYCWLGLLVLSIAKI